MDSVIKSLSDAIYYNLIREQRYMQFIQGLGISLQLTLYAAILGTVIGLFLALAKLGRIKSVSYTHLDVYKRQES